MSIAKLKKILDKAQKDGTALSLVDKIDALLKIKHTKTNSTKRLKPSMLGSPCMRKIYYSYYLAVIEDITPSGARIFDTGNAMEDMIMGWLKLLGEHVPYRNPDGEYPKDRDGKINVQFPISIPEWKIQKGFIDNISIEGDGIWIYEFKSSNEKKFDALQEPSEDHKYQATFYVIAMEKMLKEGKFDHISELKDIKKVKGIKYLYINKNNSNLKEYVITDGELLKYRLLVEAKMPKVLEFIEKKILPGPTPHFCSYCPFQKACKANFNKVV